MAYRPRRTPQLIAHRGVRGGGPHNSIPAIAAAVDAGVDMVEIDVSVTADGDAVVIHGPRLEHSTTGRGRIRRQSTDVLTDLVLLGHDGSPSPDHRVPHLDDALAALGAGVAVNVDVKDPAAISTVADALGRLGLDDRAVVSGLTARHARRVHRDHPDLTVLCNLTRLDKVVARLPALRTRWLMWRYRRLLPDVALALNINHAWVDARLVEAVHRGGAQVWVFTVDDQDRVDQLRELGVDSITTNHPERIAIPPR